MTARKARDLQPGDYVDLEGDKYADPKRLNSSFSSEYAIVESVKQETPECIAVSFEGWDTVGFPPDHELDVVETLS